MVAAILEYRERITREENQNLVDPMIDRVFPVITGNGGHTKYLTA